MILVTNIETYVSYLLKNVNIVLITKKCKYPSTIFLHSWLCVINLFFLFLLIFFFFCCLVQLLQKQLNWSKNTIFQINCFSCKSYKNIYIKFSLYLTWGQRTQQPRPTSYRAQGPCRGGRNARGWTKRVPIAKRHHQGQSYPRPTEIIRKKSGMPLKTASPGVPSKKD